MTSPDKDKRTSSGEILSLPGLKYNRHKNYSPVYSFVNGILSLQPIPLADAIAIADDVTNHFSDHLEGKKVKGAERILLDIEEQVNDITGIEVTHERIIKPRNKQEDEDVRRMYDSAYATKRILLEGDGTWLLMLGYRLTENGKIRPLLLDPHAPVQIEEKKNSWFQEALNQGYWILSVNNSLEKDVNMK